MSDHACKTESYLGLTADIVSAYVSNNPAPLAELPKLIANVSSALMGLARPVEPVPQVSTPAVNPKKSVFPDYIICLEDGLKFKSMKRHIALLGMTPEQYRIKWDLPDNYPMVAPNFTASRSKLAKKIGLGHRDGIRGRRR